MGGACSGGYFCLSGLITHNCDQNHRMEMTMKSKTTLFAIAQVLLSCRLILMAVVLSALTLFASQSAQAQTVYVGNGLTQQD